MFPRLRSLWSDTITPMLRRPPVLQIAALCHRQSSRGTELLLITSSNGRWIIPKGWPIDGMSDSQAAAQEAWEEGGVRPAHMATEPLDTILTTKTYNSGLTVPCKTKIYDLPVSEVLTDYPEKHRRDRVWVSPETAADMVADDALKPVLRHFQSRSKQDHHSKTRDRDLAPMSSCEKAT